MVHSETATVATRGFCDVLDITGLVSAVVARSGIRQGLVTVANPGSTAGVTTIEFEPGAVADLKAALERVAPEEGEYRHNATWGDGNGFAHVRSAIVGTTRTFPVRDGQVVLGTWQQIVLVDFDNRSRRRQVCVTVLGE
jgi:secondary thiamine-phosphate synthase enzyme